MLSDLAGTTGLAIKKLTSTDTELDSGIYYVEDDLTFTGADAANSTQAGGSGLKIKDGATVYIYIASGKTLTAKGGKGYDAAAGGAGTAGELQTGSTTNSGMTVHTVKKMVASTGGTGGAGATGGGAGIEVPSNAKLAVLGSGNLNAIGGNGGKAQEGAEGQKTLWYNMTFYLRTNTTASVMQIM